MFNITDVVVFPLRKELPDSKQTAFARVVINDALILNGIKIIHPAENEPFLQYPHDNYGKCEFAAFFPCSQEARELIQEKVLAAYQVTIELYKATH